MQTPQDLLQEERPPERAMTAINIEPGTRAFLKRYGAAMSVQLHEDLITLEKMVLWTEAAMDNRLTSREACVIAKALQPIPFQPALIYDAARLLYTEVKMGIESKDLDIKWGLEDHGAALLGKLAALSPWEAYVVLHWSRAFWAADPANKRRDIARMFRCSDRFDPIPEA